MQLRKQLMTGRTRGREMPADSSPYHGGLDDLPLLLKTNQPLTNTLLLWKVT